MLINKIFVNFLNEFGYLEDEIDLLTKLQKYNKIILPNEKRIS